LLPGFRIGGFISVAARNGRTLLKRILRRGRRYKRSKAKKKKTEVES